jgi:hypothetical protein
LARAYRANSSPLSQTDIVLLKQWNGYSDQWNKVSAPMLRDYYDDNVSPEQWFYQSKNYIDELESIVMKTRQLLGQLEDAGVKETLKPLIDINETILGYYRELRLAVINASVSRESHAVEGFRAAGLKKQQMAMPIIKSLREQLGSEKIDNQIQQKNAEMLKLLNL